MPRVRYMLPLLILPAVTSSASRFAVAQPPIAPSTIVKPAVNPFFAPARRPDPPQITSQELQKLTGGPTVVTFRGQNLPLPDVATALLAAGRVKESSSARRDFTQTLSVDWNQTPFWVAAAQVEKAAGRSWDGFGDGLMLWGSSDVLGLNGAIAAQTPFVTVVGNHVMRTAERFTLLGQNTVPPIRPDYVRLTMTAYFDPKLPVQSTSLRSVGFQKQGETLVVGPRNGFGFQYPSRFQTAMILNEGLSMPEGTIQGTVFSRVAGTLHLVLISATETFVVPDLLATPKATKVVGNYRYTLQNVGVNETELFFTASGSIVVFRNDDDDFGSNDIFGTLRVRDAQGRLMAGTSSPQNGNGPRTKFSYALKNAKGEVFPGPYSVEWVLTSETASLDVPFELRDVVVP